MRYQRGFTLVELIISIVGIGTVAAGLYLLYLVIQILQKLAA